MRQITHIVLLVLLATVPLRADLVNRYSFTSGPGAVDSVGGMDGTLEGSAAIAGGQLVLDGGGYASLPGDVLQDYTSATLEAWFTDDLMSGWARVFDFGDTSDGAGGYTWFFSPSGPGNARLALSTTGFPSHAVGEEQLNGPTLEAGVTYHLVCVFDEDGGQEGAPAMRLYIDGELVDFSDDTSPHLLANVARVYAYLGRATYEVDPYLQGQIDEFRIYNTPLEEMDIFFNMQMGPDRYQPCVIDSMTPVNGQDRTPRMPTLSWTVKEMYEPSEFNVYLGTDPNIADPNFTGINAFLIATTDQTSLTLETPLDYFTTYYWRVDSLIGEAVYLGPTFLFTTVDRLPLITAQPERQVVDQVGDTAVFEIEVYSESPERYYWYRTFNPDEIDPETDTLLTDPLGVFVPYFELSNVQLEDEGYYYCRIANETGEILSDVVTLGVKQFLAHWTLDEDKYVGGQYLDELGVHHADPNGTPVFVEGVAGDGVVIDPGNGWARVGTWDPSVYTGRLTVSLWAKWDGTSGWQGLIAKRNSWAADGMMWQLEVASGSGNVDFKNTAYTVSSPPLPVDEWAHVVVTFDGQTATIYRQGLSAAEGDFAFQEKLDANFVIGASEVTDEGQVEWTFNGALDDVKIYNYAMDSMDIALEYTDVSGDTVCYDPPALDYTGDCRVTLDDFAVFASHWLDCAIVPDCLP